MPFTYEYPRPAVCVDCVIFGVPGLTQPGSTEGLSVLLIERGHEPFAGMWALPGGFVDIDEPLEQAAFRELEEETGLRPKNLVFFGVYGQPGRDPRGRTISVVYRTLVWKDNCRARAGDDARQTRWILLDQLPPLAFDHNQIVSDAIRSLRRDVMTRPFGLELFPDDFVLKDLHSVYEMVLGRTVSLRRLRTFLLKWGLIQPVPASQGNHQESSGGRRHERMRFCLEVYGRLSEDGFVSDIFSDRPVRQADVNPS